jgi:hypothetical protein
MENQEKKEYTEEQKREALEWFRALQESAKRYTYQSAQVYEENGRFGVKDVCDNVLIPAQYDNISPTFIKKCSGGVIPVTNQGKMALVALDGKGTQLTSFEYDYIDYDEGCFQLLKGDSWGLASDKGQIYVPAEMDKAFYPPHNRLITFSKNGKYGFTMIEADVITEAIYDGYEMDEYQNLIVEKDGVKGYLDKEGHFTSDREKSFFNAAN